MTTELQQEIVFDDFSGGVIDPLAVSDSLLPKNCVRKAVNLLFDRPRGAVTTRLGTTSLTSSAVNAGKTAQGIHNFRHTTVASSQLLYVFNGTIYSLSGTSSNAEYASLDASAKARFLTYLNQVAVMNGVDGVRYSTGAGSWATGGNMDTANWPVTKAAAILNGRIGAIGNSTNPSRLYESSIVSGGAVSWTSGNRNTEVKPNDGAGELTSITSNGRMFLLFKERALYRYDGNSLEFIVAIGTPSHESVVTDDQGVTYYFGQGANSVGFYATTGGYPKKISRPVQTWVEAIASSYYANVAGYTNGNKIVWPVGACTVDGISYANVHLSYNTADQTWEIYNYADSFRVFSQYINSSGALTIVGGDTDGFVQTIDSGFTDGIVGSTAGTDIFYECNFQPTALTSRSRTKCINEMVTFCKDPQGLNFYLGTNDEDYVLVGTATDRENVFQELKTLRGQRFYPRIAGSNSGPQLTFEGYSFTKVADEGVLTI